MIRSDLPSVTLASLPGGPDVVVLCATPRLAADLRRGHGELQAASGAKSWPALQSATAPQWLEHLTSGALLRGEIPAHSVPGMFLNRSQERALWEQIIASDTRDAGAVLELFDRDGMARAAFDAASLKQVWRIDVPEHLHTEEYRVFLRWQSAVSEACDKNRWCTGDQALRWRVDCIARGIGGLPHRIGIAGFMAPDPSLSRLLMALEARGVDIFRLDFGYAGSADSSLRECTDAAAECDAAAAWAAAWVSRASAEQRVGCVRIAVADLPAQRRVLESALDAALQPDRVGAGWAAVERPYIFSAGAPLADQALVDVGLRLLQCFVHPRHLAHAELGSLLCTPGWSADITEADARACLELRLRELLPVEASLERFQQAIARLSDDLVLPGLVAHLTALVNATRTSSRRQLPGAWGKTFEAVLANLGWPGERGLLQVERAACTELREALLDLRMLDSVIGRVDAAEALRLLQRACRDTAFIAPRRSMPLVEVCSLEDAVAASVDALWVMGVIEGQWPPTPKPNPMLPAELQRRAGIVNARADSLAAQSRLEQDCWLHSARTIVVSWASREGERELGASPLVSTFAGDGRCELPDAMVPRQDESHSVNVALEYIYDARAPAVGDDERIRGGTTLLQAQAICPAWGFYRYRLGAAVPPAPTFGLDARARGSLVHGALEAFWSGRSHADLVQMGESERLAIVDLAIDRALSAHDARALDPLTPRLRALEQARLGRLLTVWLDVESRRVPFRVVACEQRHDLNIEGLPVRVVVDRIDELDDGRLVIIDYKSGRNVTADRWAEARISEPQLPIYAALAFPDRAVAAVVLARVIVDDPAFLGVAEDAGILPGIKSLEEQGKRYVAEVFPDWDSLRRGWAERLSEIAREVRDGCAAVVYTLDKDIQYCDVKPLLRLAERREQYERQRCGIPL